eukprot:1052925-Pyramimonas_sp.AAC.2
MRPYRCDSLVWVELAATQLHEAHRQFPSVGCFPRAVRLRPFKDMIHQMRPPNTTQLAVSNISSTMDVPG